MTEYDEPQGYLNKVTYVKANPLNNETYLNQACEMYPEWAETLRATDLKLQEIIPGYNIAQIKAKFFALRYCIDFPEDTDPEVQKQAWEILNEAEQNCVLKR